MADTTTDVRCGECEADAVDCLACLSCGGWRGRHLVDTEGHRAHVRAVEAGGPEWLHVINESASI